MKHDISGMHEKITLMLGELTNCVRDEEFKIAIKYLELWEPANFVTREEAKAIVQKSKSI